ncbi:MAG: Ig-like domain-containing protein [Anaerolineae bacterium]
MQQNQFRLLAIVMVLTLVFSPIGRTLAAAGDLDTTFNATGYNVSDLGGIDEAYAVTVQSDGKIVAAGYSTGTTKQFALARYTSSGALDLTFGSSGKVSTSIGSGDAIANAIAVQSDGQIILAGSSLNGAAKSVFTLARYISTTGALDPSFGTGGIVTTSLSAGADIAHALAVQNDGKLVVAGEANAQFAMARYTITGTLDTTFNGTGFVTTTIVGSNNIAHAVLIQPADGKIILVGEVNPGSSNDFALVRYNSNGSLDGTFGASGKTVTDFPAGTNDIAYAAALQADGKIVAAGSINATGSDFAVARYTSGGLLDSTFGSGGLISTTLGSGADEAHGVVVQGNGKIVVGGWSTQGTRKLDFALARYQTNGALDANFGASGLVTTTLQSSLTSDDIGYALALQSDNKIVVAGSSDDGTASGFDFAVARYQSPNAAPTLTDIPKNGLEDQTVTFTSTDFTAHFSDTDGDPLDRIQITSLPANGTLRLSGVAVTLNQEITAANLSNLTFVPTANFNGSTSFGWNGFDGLVYAASSANVNFTITAVNDAPSFSLGSAPTVLEDGGATSLTTFASSISPGPADEAGQVVTFTVTNNNNALFSAQPAINSIGTLTFTPAPNANGTATVTVSLKDSGGTANGGVDTSAPQTLVVTVTSVNDAPSFTKGSDLTAFEDTGAHTVLSWATNVSAGPSNESGQALTFTLINSNNALFSSQPAINAAGDLAYTLAPNAYGSAVVTVTLKDNGGTANGGVDTSASQTFNLTVNPVNDAPTFTTGSNVTINEDAGAQTQINWATNISPGPFEAAQIVTFTVLNDNNALFAVQPAVSPSGTLTFTPAPNQFGSANVTVFLRDSGGTANGGIDTSAPQAFSIVVNSVNDAPTFTKGADQNLLEDVGPQTITGWATSISPGPANEATQLLTFTLTTDNAALFSAQPAVNATTGNLTFTPAANAFGTAIVTATLKDSGGTANGGLDTSVPQTFIINVQPVNDIPSFTKGSDQIVLEDVGAMSIANWATTISAGPANEASQVLTFTVTNDNNALFAAQPALSPIGTLTFTPAPNVYGTANVTVALQDSGGTTNGGVDTTAPQVFAITVVSVNDAPTFTLGANQAINEDSGPQTVSSWATSISPGPNEAGQLVTFTLTTNNAALFSVPPDVNATSGDLTYTPAADAFGTATITITLKDNGGTANGGQDTSAPQTFTIDLLPVNDAPSFVKGADVTVNEDAGIQTIGAWATAISAGPTNEASQALTFTLTSDNAALFSAQPAINASTGALSFTSAPNAFGTATITITLQDSGGTDRGGVDTSAAQTFTLTVNAVNDAPSFAKGPNLTVFTSTLQIFAGWATVIKPGPTNESSQLVDFIVTNNNPGLFETQPSIAADGTLTFKPAVNYSGSALVTVQLHDDGGTANSGIDTSVPQTFAINVNAGSGAPVNVVPGSQETNQNTPLIFSTANGNHIGVYDASAIQFDEPISVTLTVSHGVVTLNGSMGLTLTTGLSGSLVQFTGSITDVNAALDGLQFVPELDFFGSTTLVISTQDLGHPGQPASVIVSDPIDVRVSAPPSAVDDAYSTLENQTLIVSAANGVLKNDVPRNARPLSAAIATNPAAGTLVLNSDGSFVYLPPANSGGIYTFTYRASDNGLLSNLATVTVTVQGVNQAPVFNLGAAPVVNEDSGAQSIGNFISGVSAGGGETGQALTLTIETDRPALFTALPALDLNTRNLTFTPAPDQFGATIVTVTLRDDGGTVNGGVDTTVQTFTLTINPINDAPSFIKGADQTTTINSGPQTVAGWASAISAGPTNESSQLLTFNLITNNNPLFAIAPSIDPASGALTYTPAPGKFGTATITATLQDNGGTANGGINSSAPQTFVITVTPYQLYLPLIRR